MLVLTRKLNERICIGDDIILTVTQLSPERVKIGIEAPKEMEVYREEIYLDIQKNGKRKKRGVGRNLLYMFYF